MKMKYEVTAFQLGYSTVITLPKELGIKPGQKLKIKKERKQLILKEKKLIEEEIRKLVRKLSGNARLKDVTPEELNQELDRRYEEMFPGY